jgi:hypothetical protein
VPPTEQTLERALAKAARAFKRGKQVILYRAQAAGQFLASFTPEEKATRGEGTA